MSKTTEPDPLIVALYSSLTEMFRSDVGMEVTFDLGLDVNTADSSMIWVSKGRHAFLMYLEDDTLILTPLLYKYHTGYQNTDFGQIIDYDLSDPAAIPSLFEKLHELSSTIDR